MVVNGMTFCKWSRLGYQVIVPLCDVLSKQMFTLEFPENMVVNGIVLWRWSRLNDLENMVVQLYTTLQQMVTVELRGEHGRVRRHVSAVGHGCVLVRTWL